MVNKKLFVGYLVFLLAQLVACCSGGILLSDKNSKNKSLTKVEIDFIPDTSVNGQIFLFSNLIDNNIFSTKSATSLKQFNNSGFGYFRFENSLRTEYLNCYFAEGNKNIKFQIFEIGLLNNSSDSADKTCFITMKFQTESGINLGLNKNELVKIKGENFAYSNDSIVRYEINNFDKSAFLKAYNMPEYFLECSIENSKIYKIKYGFSMP